MALETILIFIPACFALNMAFGPNNLLSMTVGARYGMATVGWPRAAGWLRLRA